MALSTRVKTSVDLHVSPEARRVVAIDEATKIEVKLVEAGLSFDQHRLFALADDVLEWINNETETEEEDND